MRPAEAVADEIRELKEQLWRRASLVWRRCFRAESPLDATSSPTRWKSDNASLPFKIQSRADLMTKETVDALRSAPDAPKCGWAWSPARRQILDAMDKGLRVAEVVAAHASSCRRAGIRACYFLQFGYPGETWDDIQQTIALVRDTRPDDIGVSVSYPLPNTRFYEKVQANSAKSATGPTVTISA